MDGLIVAPVSDDHSYLHREMAAGTSVVFADRPPVHLAADAVLTDNTAGARRGVGHLLDHGHCRVAYLGDRHTLPTASRRYEGWAAAHTDRGLPVDPALVRHDLRTEDEAEQAALALLGSADPPTAVFTSQNLVTLGTLRAMRTLGLRRRVALVGFDDLEAGDLLEPGLTVVAQDPAAMGAAAAQRLFARLDGDTGRPQTVVVPTRLLVRGSGEIPPPG